MLIIQNRDEQMHVENYLFFIGQIYSYESLNPPQIEIAFGGGK